MGKEAYELFDEDLGIYKAPRKATFKGLDEKRVRVFPEGANPEKCHIYTGTLFVDQKHPHRATLDGPITLYLAIWNGRVYERHLNSNRIWGKPFTIEQEQQQ